MKLPPALADSDLYVIGHNQEGEAEAFVVAKFPFAACLVCNTAHALFFVRDDGYECILCNATKQGRTSL
jgi:hypothetical protein